MQVFGKVMLLDVLIPLGSLDQHGGGRTRSDSFSPLSAAGVPAILNRVAPSDRQVRALLRDAEDHQRERFETELADELALVDDASSLLAKVVGMAVGRGGEVEIEVDDDTGVPSDADADAVQLIALRYLGIRGLRVVRAAQSVLATGYEPEARVYERILLEIIEHTQSVLRDPSGKTALEWLKGSRRRGVTRRVRAMGTGDLYSRLSRDSHGDPDPVVALIDLSHTLELGPRRTIATRVALVRHAAYCRDHAVALCRAVDVTLDGLPALDARIFARWSAIDPEHTAAS